MATVEPVQGLRGPAGLAKKITGWFIVLAVLFIILGSWRSRSRWWRRWPWHCWWAGC